METDRELLRAYAATRSEAAFAELVRRHLDLVYSAALRQVSGDTHRAQDVTQLVFIDLARRAPELTNHTALRGWLYTSTHHAAANVVRGENRRRVREQEALAMQMSDSESAVNWERLRPVLDDAMHELPERDRHAVLMRWFDQKPTTEIATALGLSESAARRLTDRALDDLRTLLARRSITSTAAALGTVIASQAVLAAPPEMARTVVIAGTASAGASPASPFVATLAHTTKAQLVILGLTAVFNLGIIRLLWVPSDAPAASDDIRTAPGQPSNLPPFVPPALPIVGDYSDPMFLGKKLVAEGYADDTVRDAIRAALGLRYTPQFEAIDRQYGLARDQRPRWKPMAPEPAAARLARQNLNHQFQAEADAAYAAAQATKPQAPSPQVR